MYYRCKPINMYSGYVNISQREKIRIKEDSPSNQQISSLACLNFIHCVMVVYYLSHVMRKPVYAICDQQRHRSACASADQPAHLHSLIGAFVVRCLDSIIPLVSISKISSLYLSSTNPEDRFSSDKAYLI